MAVNAQGEAVCKARMTVRVPVRMLCTGSQGDSCAALYKGETVNATAVFNTMARSPDTEVDTLLGVTIAALIASARSITNAVALANGRAPRPLAAARLNQLLLADM